MEDLGVNMSQEIKDIERGIFDKKNPFEFSKISDKGLTEEIVRMISKEKNEPDWMLEYRLEGLRQFYKLDNPTWGPDLSEVNIDDITTYVKPKSGMKADWKDLPDDIRNTFYDLGIPQAEIESLSGVGAQYDSEIVYHRTKDYLKDQGVIYTDMESALREYPEIVKEHFMKVIKPDLHKYAALHYAVWSGGSFVYVPKGVKVDIPLQSYFRLNAPGAGQFEHTLIIVEDGGYCHFIEGCSAPKYNVVNIHAGAVELIIKENAGLRYSTIENWSRNMYNLNTKRALVSKNGKIEWISGSFGSKVSMLYPTSVLNGDNAISEYVGISFAGKGQNIDTGHQVIHAAKNTYSTTESRSICKDGGISSYRGLVYFTEDSDGSKASSDCESLMLDNESVSDNIPSIVEKNSNIDVGHEAKIGRIDDKQIYYLMTRGISEDEAKAILVRGFAEPVAKELPMEYAVEMNTLINLELENTIG